MSHIDTLRAGHEAFNARDFKAAATGLLGMDGEFTDHARGASSHGPKEFQGWLESFMVTSSDLQIVDARYIDGGDWVTAIFRAEGTQDGPLGTFPATDMPFTLDICEVWHFGSNGLADEGHNYSDGLGMLMKLGHITAPK